MSIDNFSLAPRSTESWDRKGAYREVLSPLQSTWPRCSGVPSSQEVSPQDPLQGALRSPQGGQWVGWDDLTESVEYAPVLRDPPREFVFKSLRDIEQLKRRVGESNTEVVNLGD